MNTTPALVAALLCGTGVVVATSAAARLPGAWAGILAALPVTPTAGILALGGAVDGASALRGFATIAAALIVTILLLTIRPFQHRAGIAVGLAAIAPIAFLIDRMALPFTAATAMAALSVSRAFPSRPTSCTGIRARISWPIRFAVGAGSVAVVAASEALHPGVGVLVAMMPVLFVTSLAVVLLEHGSQVAMGMLRGGVAGSAGMVAFVTAYAIGWHQGVPALPALGLGWVAFVGIALAWRRIGVGQGTTTRGA